MSYSKSMFGQNSYQNNCNSGCSGNSGCGGSCSSCSSGCGGNCSSCSGGCTCSYVQGTLVNICDVSYNRRLFVGGDVSLGAGLYVAGKTNLVGVVSMGSRFFVAGDASLGAGLYVAGKTNLVGDVSLAGSLYVAGNTVFNQLPTSNVITATLSGQLITKAYADATYYSSFNSSLSLGNVAVVDAVYGNNSIASVGGKPYLTVAAAIAAVTVGQTVWVLPGTHNLASGITIPTGVALRGINTQTAIIQMLGVAANTTLVTMGENSRVEDITFKLTSSGHYTLTGIAFGGTTSITAKLRTCVLTVDNSTASSGGTSDVTGVLCSGTGTLGPGSFSFNSLKGATVNVYSNGAGNKRGVLVNNSNIMTTRDFNVYVAQPASTASTGSYVGVEVNDPGNTGSIQMRATTIGCVLPTGVQAYTASDILQTTPATITNPTYLATAGIQIGPGTDLVTKTAGSHGFSTFVYPTTVFYGLKGAVGNVTAGYLWPGSQEVKNNTFPDPTIPAAFYRAQQPTLLSGISVSLGTAPSGTTGTRTVECHARYTPSTTGIITDTSFTVTLTNSDISGSFYNSSKTLLVGDKLHLYFSNTGGGANTAADLTVQLDLF